MKRIAKITAVVFAITAIVAAILFVVWLRLVPEPDSHHGPRYVLWKHRLYPFNPDIVFKCLGADPDADSIVAGLTMSQVKRRFGYVRTREAANDYQRFYNAGLPAEILWLGDTPWVVVFTNGLGVEIRLMKG